MTAQEAVQQAQIDLLTGAAALVALVGEKVFDEVPGENDGVLQPLVYLGPVNHTRLETGYAPAWTVRSRWFVESTDFGRLEAWEIAEAMIDALDGAEPELAVPYRLQEPLRVVQAGDTTDPDAPKLVFVDTLTTVTKTTA